MPVSLKRAELAIEPVAATSPWMHAAFFAAAGIFVAMLVTTYGLDLSPGFF